MANPKVAGDPQLHTHVTTPNVVVCDGGSVGGMDMLALHDRVHEVGAYYQAHLATNLRAFGIEVVLDERTETAKMTAVPDAFCEVFELRNSLRPSPVTTSTFPPITAGYAFSPQNHRSAGHL